MSSSTEAIDLDKTDDPTFEKTSSRFKKEVLIVVIIGVLGVVLLITGIVLVANAGTNGRSRCTSTEKHKGKEESVCAFSAEAKRIGFEEYLNRVKSTYYRLHPYNIYYDPDVRLGTGPNGRDRVKAEFTAYDTTPSVIKNRTDAARKLLEEINNKEIDLDLLKPRERKALIQVKHYLQHVFGSPYDVNFYAGDWMMGPDLFCYREICYLGYGVYNALGHYHKPSNLDDVELIRKKLVTHKVAIAQYIENMKMGVRKGMIRNILECKAGIDAIKRAYFNTSRFNETGVLKEWFVKPILMKEYYSNITNAMEVEWKKTHNNMGVNESMKQFLVDYIGKPIVGMLRYLKEEHLRHCVPTSVSSGLGSLPVKYVYWDGIKNESWSTDPTLPITGTKLDGKKSYAMIMSYFTTNNMTPDQVHELGLKMLNILYPKILQVAREVTGLNNNDTAVKKFREILNSTASYFNDPIPQNESDEDAFRKCSDLKGAKRYCPKRWDAIQNWFKEARKVMSMLDPKIVGMFYFTGSKHTTPNCPIDLRPDLNPSSGAQSYDASNRDCTHSATYYIPFFLGRMGPKFSEWSVNAHEARPGHHLQVQGKIEHFQDSCSGSISWLNSETYYTAFTEGWALYAENPLIAEDTNTYENELMQKFGMLKWQLWRALRLIVDTGLHYKGMTRAEALKYFNDKAWDGTDLAQKEVTRYQSDPGQATAYMIGQLDIKKARKYATDELGDIFNLKEFHYQVLSQGSSPLAYLSDHVHRYVACKKDPKGVGCAEMLKPPKKTTASARHAVLRKKEPFPILRPPKRHYL